MLRYAQRVRSHTASGRKSINDELARDGVLYELAIIGEAAGRTSEAMRQAHPEVPWPQIVAQRNILVHVYDKLDLDLLWRAVETIPALEANLESILQELDHPDQEHHHD